MAETALSPINSSKGIAVPVSSCPHNTNYSVSKRALVWLQAEYQGTNSAAKQPCIPFTASPHKPSL